MDAETTCERSAAVAEVLAEHLIGIDHIAVAVPDLAEAIEWYTGKLGFRVLEKRTTRGERTSMCSAVLAAGRVVVVLVQGNEPDSQVSRFVEKFGAGVQHIAFSVNDLPTVLSRLLSAGGHSDTPLIEDEGIRQIFLRRDPGSGVRIELIERLGGTFTDRTVEQLFKAFEAEDLY